MDVMIQGNIDILTKYFERMWGAVGAGDDGRPQRGLKSHDINEDSGKCSGSRAE